MMKAPTAEEVVALVNAATGPDGTLDPATHQLILQLQAQHALLQAQNQAQTQKDASESTHFSETKTAHTGTTSTAMAVSAAVAMESDAAPESATSTAEVAVPICSPPQSAKPVASAVIRKSIPLSMKKEAIHWIMGPGEGVPSRAERHFGALNWDVAASSFRKWWKNRDAILGNSGAKKRISGGGRKPFLDDSEEKLLVVVIQERAKKERVTRKWIAKTAQHMFQRSDSTFKASENWVTKFIRRNGLTLKRSYVTYEPAKVEQRQSQTTAATGNTYVNGNVKIEFFDL